jgi:uncharacterized spore protein YtfJ
MSNDKAITDVVRSLLDGIHGISRSETIVGEPQTAGDATIIPIHRIKLSFGAGTASAGPHASAAGGAVELEPVAAIAVDREGHAHVLPVEGDAGGTWSALLDEVPDLVARLARRLGDRVAHEVSSRGLGDASAAGGASRDAGVAHIPSAIARGKKPEDPPGES